MGKITLVTASRGLAVSVALVWCVFSAMLALQTSAGETVTSGSPSTMLLASSIVLAAVTAAAWACIALARRNWGPALWGLVVAFVNATVINAMFDAHAPRTFTPSAMEGAIAAAIAFAFGVVLVWQAFARDKAPVLASRAAVE